MDFKVEPAGLAGGTMVTMLGPNSEFESSWLLASDEVDALRRALPAPPFANGARLLAAFPMMKAGQPDGLYVAFERGPDDTVPGSDRDRYGSAWIRSLDASSWSWGEYVNTAEDAIAAAIERAGWSHVSVSLADRQRRAAQAVRERR